MLINFKMRGDTYICGEILKWGVFQYFLTNLKMSDINNIC